MSTQYKNGSHEKELTWAVAWQYTYSLTVSSPVWYPISHLTKSSAYFGYGINKWFFIKFNQNNDLTAPND